MYSDPKYVPKYIPKKKVNYYIGIIKKITIQ